MSFSSNDVAAVRRRRRLRRIRFFVYEAIALALFFAALIAAISQRSAAGLIPFFKFLPVATAILAGVIPILLFGNGRR